nr:helix-turn-helix transcriptional regulator [Larsenimonas salina]
MSSGWAALEDLAALGAFPAWRNRLQTVPISPGLCLSLSEWLDTGQSDRTNIRICGLARQLAGVLEPFAPVNGFPADVCPRLLALRQHLETHWQVPHSLEVLAQRACMSSSTLRSRFRTAFGYSVFGYLREVRLQRAHELLMSGASVQRVSDVVGYGHVGNFSTAYRRRFGHAPTNARPAAHRS